MDKRYNNWLREVYPSLQLVEKAIAEGVTLTKQETFDYYFKKFLFDENISKTLFRSDVYKISRYYALVFKGLFKLRSEGYNNKTAEKFAKKIIRYAFVHRISGRYSMLCYDSNGVFYMELHHGPKREHTFAISSKKDFSESIIALTTYLSLEGIPDEEINSDDYAIFLSSYLINAANEILSSRKPEPYVYTGTKTLKGFILQDREKCKKTKNPADYNNIIEFNYRVQGRVI